MRLNKNFYKSIGFYYGLILIVVPLTVIFEQRMHLLLLNLLFMLTGLIFLVHAICRDNPDEWLINGHGGRLSFNRHFYRSLDFYMGIVLVLVDLPQGTGEYYWGNILFMILGISSIIFSMLRYKN